MERKTESSFLRNAAILADAVNRGRVGRFDAVVRAVRLVRGELSLWFIAVIDGMPERGNGYTYRTLEVRVIGDRAVSAHWNRGSESVDGIVYGMDKAAGNRCREASPWTPDRDENGPGFETVSGNGSAGGSVEVDFEPEPVNPHADESDAEAA